MPLRPTGLVAVTLLIALITFPGCLGPVIHGNIKDNLMAPEKITELKTGRTLSPDRLAADLSGTRVVFLGEIHDHPLQHQRQLEIIEALWQENRNLVIGLELFEHPAQNLLDRWVNGLIPEKDFKKELESALGTDTMSVYFPLLKWAAKRGTPLLALGLPRKISSLVAKNGLTGLNDEQLQALPREMEIGPEEYRQRISKAFLHHGMFMDLENFFTAQVARDEAMAQTLADFLAAPKNSARRVVVIAGNEHVANGYGLPDRVGRRLPVVRASLLMPDNQDDYPLLPSSADYAWVSPPSPKRRSRLGITLRNDDNEQLIVTAVFDDSLAKKIGLKPGDLLIRMNGIDLKSAMDLHRAATARKEGPENNLDIQRDGRSMNFKFVFEPVSD